MKESLMIFLILGSVTFFSCSNKNYKEKCKDLIEAKVFSSGFPNINFPIKQQERDVRKNAQGVILKKERLNRISALISNLETCSPEGKELLGSINGVCDFRCQKGRGFTLLYDRFSIRINDDVYCVNHELINELFGKKTDQLN